LERKGGLKKKKKLLGKSDEYKFDIGCQRYAVNVSGYKKVFSWKGLRKKRKLEKKTHTQRAEERCLTSKTKEPHAEAKAGIKEEHKGEKSLVPH